MPTGAFTTATELRGLALPALRGPGGFFASKNQFDVAWGDLLMAIFVPRGSRPMQRQFGSTLYDLLFDPIDIENEIIEASVRDIAAQFCPQVLIRRVTIKNSAAGHIQVGIVFSLASDIENEGERSVLIPKTVVTEVGAI